MQAIVRKAQCDFQFATIYEQRKTNQVLVAAFTSLAEALDSMAWQIAASIDGLASSVDEIALALNESRQVIDLRMGDIHKKLSIKASQIAEREEKALEMLDNIQRRRRTPFP